MGGADVAGGASRRNGGHAGRCNDRSGTNDLSSGHARVVQAFGNRAHQSKERVVANRRAEPQAGDAQYHRAGGSAPRRRASLVPARTQLSRFGGSCVLHAGEATWLRQGALVRGGRRDRRDAARPVRAHLFCKARIAEWRIIRNRRQDCSRSGGGMENYSQGHRAPYIRHSFYRTA